MGMPEQTQTKHLQRTLAQVRQTTRHRPGHGTTHMLEERPGGRVS
jgi:hypothetical protein